ncbi:ufm1-specific protease 2-like isoform X2 [Halichondria panicea]|uniref:ufm1-specific protease 2-like isoform X2 n=1 Tax=Halichondria panicea TaxID=6063 RepID=UPI00312B4F3B
MDLLDLTKQVSASAVLDPSTTATIKHRCTFHHYCCDGIDDKNWGCGYRTLQSLCSWAVGQVAITTSVPSVRDIQQILVEVGDKSKSHVGSRDWIGTYEACMVMDHLYWIACRIIHMPQGASILDQLPVLSAHFTENGSPVMIGGDVDGASKTLLGVSTHPPLFLIADPHYVGPSDKDIVIASGFIKWHGPELFQTSSFYNFCLPLSN